MKLKSHTLHGEIDTGVVLKCAEANWAAEKNRAATLHIIDRLAPGGSCRIWTLLEGGYCHASYRCVCSCICVHQCATERSRHGIKLDVCYAFCSACSVAVQLGVSQRAVSMRVRRGQLYLHHHWCCDRADLTVTLASINKSSLNFHLYLLCFI